MSGGVLWGRDLARLVPEYWTDDTVAFERFITHRRLTLMDETSAFTLDYKSDAYAEPPYMGVSILRSRFDRWLADRVEEAIANSAHPYGSFLATNVRVDEGLQDGSGRATGIRAGDETFHADSVMIAEGELIGCFGLTEPDHGSDPGSYEGTYDIHGLILGREITGIQAFKPLGSPGENGAAEATKEREAATAE